MLNLTLLTELSFSSIRRLAASVALSACFLYAWHWAASLASSLIRVSNRRIMLESENHKSYITEFSSQHDQHINTQVTHQRSHLTSALAIWGKVPKPRALTLNVLFYVSNEANNNLNNNKNNSLVTYLPGLTIFSKLAKLLIFLSIQQ